MSRLTSSVEYSAPDPSVHLNECKGKQPLSKLVVPCYSPLGLLESYPMCPQVPNRREDREWLLYRPKSIECPFAIDCRLTGG